MTKYDLRAKINIADTGGQVRVRRTKETAWQELALYLEVVAFLAGNAIDEGNPAGITNRKDMSDYIVQYFNRAMPDYSRIGLEQDND